MATPVQVATSETDHGFFGHPRGLSTLFFTEMWERFSYYGMRAFLILYMVAPAASGGLGFTDARAASIYGTYTGSAWAASILGGLIADRLLGQYRTVLIGGIIIAAGHFTLAVNALPFFYTGLALIAFGTGCLKPNVSTLVGSLYPRGDIRRDAGFSVFYMGINLGALFGPLIAGYLAQRVNWHIGFACAGVGMTLGLVQYVVGRQRLQQGIARLGQKPVVAMADTAVANRTAEANPGFSGDEWKRIGAIVIFFMAATVFWGGYEQAGSTLNLFADRYTRLEVFGFAFPSSWFQSVQPAFVIILAPVFGWLWVRLGRRQPSSPAKFALGLIFLSLSFMILIPAGALASGAGIRVSPWWLVGSYFVSEIGELCVSPIGLSAVTKLAPLRIVGLMMGVWFLSNAFGNKLAGWAAGFFSSMPLNTLFTIVTAVLLAAAVVMFAIIKPSKRLMGDVR
ncbi:MAG TPA: peptide MFS transporter [Vicinamibacterales bacterium]|nr:peptide MFS transporter [Vicinamibacterales bacterium]